MVPLAAYMSHADLKTTETRIITTVYLEQGMAHLWRMTDLTCRIIKKRNKLKKRRPLHSRWCMSDKTCSVQIFQCTEQTGHTKCMCAARTVSGSPPPWACETIRRNVTSGSSSWTGPWTHKVVRKSASILTSWWLDVDQWGMIADSTIVSVSVSQCSGWTSILEGIIMGKKALPRLLVQPEDQGTSG